MLQRAIEIATKAHQDQIRANAEPYILHSLRVMFKVAPGTIIMSAAVLHDVIEDTDWTLGKLQKENFSLDILKTVDDLTKMQDEDYFSYIRQIYANPIATVIKIADLEDNISVLQLPFLKEYHLKRIAKYHKAWRILKGF